jgi:NAD(P)-dependent dehydrogenase (short-subunit alcohol dehydrogenase family)
MEAGRSRSADLEGKAGVVTGAASGIGAATARRFVEAGARVVLTDIQVDAGRTLAERLGKNAVFLSADVRKEDEVSAAVDAAVERFGALDFMVNNAGVIGVGGSIVNLSAQAWQNTLDILLNGVFYGIKHAARVMIPRGSGAIVSVSSTAGVLGGLGPHAYTTAKHAVIGLTKSAASELAAHGIRVNCVAPGNTVSAMTARAITGDSGDTATAAAVISQGSLLGYAGMPEDQAAAILFLAGAGARYISGHTLVVDAGQTSSNPVNEINRGPAKIY